jgi:hypothetical protein
MVFLLSYKHFLDFGVGREEELLSKKCNVYASYKQSSTIASTFAFSSGKARIENLFCWSAPKDLISGNWS